MKINKEETNELAIGTSARQMGKCSIYLGEWATDDKDEDYQFIFTTKLGFTDGVYSKFQTTMSHEEYEVIYKVILRAIENQTEFVVPVYIGHDAGESVIDK